MRVGVPAVTSLEVAAAMLFKAPCAAVVVVNFVTVKAMPLPPV